MPFVTRKTLLILSTPIVTTLVLIAGIVWSGAYNIGADDPHWRPTHALLETVRHRSIDVRASRLQVPADLDDPARIRQGAGNYDAMCTGCHLTPGMGETEMSKGLYPAPPDLTKERVDAAHAFWVIKHGIKASAMPAWGKSMDDAYIWNMAAFLQQLPKLNAEQYQTLVASSGGHSHGGGETKPHDHAEGEADYHGAMEGMPMNNEAKPHSHAPGTPSHDDTPQAESQAKESKPHAHPPGTPPHDDARKPAVAATESKPHTHAPGTPPHNDATPVKSATSEKTSPEPVPAEQDAHDHHDHQH
ncbi:c-type cytochrome [Lysobacter niastensis]|uniref:C-type cytochrome n=1 Tax=Lysobacter niastensis TaxID=380629 RepID=A0ABS0BCY3_9GAMM|nr:cytochrome c [Lysobacter niastensis]MBF6024869.1 c-type cytochrome [Lysobacter niastensis]